MYLWFSKELTTPSFSPPTLLIMMYLSYFIIQMQNYKIVSFMIQIWLFYFMEDDNFACFFSLACFLWPLYYSLVCGLQRIWYNAEVLDCDSNPWNWYLLFHSIVDYKHNFLIGFKHQQSSSCSFFHCLKT